MILDSPAALDEIVVSTTIEEPLWPRMETPDLMLPAMILACSVELMETVPPEVYPAGIETVPVFVEIVPLVDPLFAIDPLVEPPLMYALLPVRMLAAVAVASDVS